MELDSLRLKEACRRLRGKIPTGDPYLAMALTQDMMDLAVAYLQEHPEEEECQKQEIWRYRW